MSTGAVNKVIQRAVSDAAFRSQLQRDPQSALTGFELSATERAAIASGDPSRLTSLGVDQRMSKAFGLSGIGDLNKIIASDATSGTGALIDEQSSGATRALVGDETTGSAALAGDPTTGSAALVGDATQGAAAMVGDPSLGSSALISPEGDVLDSGAVSDDTTGAAHAVIGDPGASMDSAFATPDGSYLDAGFVSDPTGGASPMEIADPQIEGTQVDSPDDF